MRVIAGELRGRRLKSVPGANTRPTTDKVKEALFNMIGPYFSGGSCLDMYSGSGALAIEAVSRGIDQAFLAEKNHQALQVIRENLKALHLENRTTVLAGDARKNAKKLAVQHPHLRFQLVFLDPPYQAEKIAEDILLLKTLDLIDERTTIVCETDRNHDLTQQIEGYKKVKHAEYGTIVINIFEVEGEIEDDT